MIMVARADKAHYNPSCAVLFQRGTFTSHAAGDIKDAHMPIAKSGWDFTPLKMRDVFLWIEKN